MSYKPTPTSEFTTIHGVAYTKRLSYDAERWVNCIKRPLTM